MNRKVKQLGVGPFMAGRTNDNRERDMQQPPHVRERLMKLYEQWDEVLAALRKQAAQDGICINNKIKEVRRAFDTARHQILYGHQVERLENLFTEYTAELRKTGGDSVELVIKEARKECDQMIRDIVNKVG